ncbi:unnamed protein product [Closterium sp. Naga37s-1]|nr:unnamed protein product [Closterium sp. Naga37s-1]
MTFRSELEELSNEADKSEDTDDTGASVEAAEKQEEEIVTMEAAAVNGGDGDGVNTFAAAIVVEDEAVNAKCVGVEAVKGDIMVKGSKVNATAKGRVLTKEEHVEGYETREVLGAKIPRRSERLKKMPHGLDIKALNFKTHRHPPCLVPLALSIPTRALSSCPLISPLSPPCISLSPAKMAAGTPLSDTDRLSPHLTALPPLPSPRSSTRVKPLLIHSRCPLYHAPPRHAPPLLPRPIPLVLACSALTPAYRNVLRWGDGCRLDGDVGTAEAGDVGTAEAGDVGTAEAGDPQHTSSTGTQHSAPCAPRLLFILLDVPPLVLADRLAQRHHSEGHFMPPCLLPSQLALLAVGDDEGDVVRTRADRALECVVDDVVSVVAEKI